MLFYELVQLIITKLWSIEITKILRAKVLGLLHEHIRLQAVSLKEMILEKPLMSFSIRDTNVVRLLIKCPSGCQLCVQNFKSGTRWVYGSPETGVSAGHCKTK